ncbi:MAG: hypothetical protein U0996_22290 [Planctomycetaceae bacterium]
MYGRAWLLVLVARVLCVDLQCSRAGDAPPVVANVQALQLSSLNADVFAFQFYRKDLQTRDVRRWWLSSGKSPCGVAFFESALPLTFTFEHQSLLFKPTGTFRQSPTPAWAFSIDGDLISQGSGAVPSDGNCFVAIDLPTCLDELVSDAGRRTKARSSGETLVWSFDYGQNGSVAIWLRTPNDELALGTALRRWEVQTTKFVAGISALTVNSDFDLLVADANFDIEATHVSELPDFAAEEIKDLGGECAMKGYRLFSDLSAVSSLDQFAAKKDERIAIAILVKKVLPDGRHQVSTAWLREYCVLCRELRNYSMLLQTEDGMPIDDQAVRWGRIEQFLGAKLSYATTYVMPRVLQNGPFSLAERIRLVDACADLGESQFLKEYEKIFQAEHGDLYRSILKAHHQHPHSDTDIKLCRDYLERVPENSPASHCLIESLILMGEIEKIPPHLVDRWYGDVMFSGTRADQMEVLRQLTLVASGRQWLRNHLQSLTDLSETDRLAVNALQQRASATRKTSRWDFMSETV